MLMHRYYKEHTKLHIFASEKAYKNSGYEIGSL